MEIETQTPTQTQNPAPPTVTPAPPTIVPPPANLPSGHHHITAWVALIIVAAIAATAGYLVWAKAHETWPYDEVDLSSPSTSLGTTGDVAGWKTYRNEEYGFEFKYPADLVINRFDGSDGKTFVVQPAEFAHSFYLAISPVKGIVGNPPEAAKESNIRVGEKIATQRSWEQESGTAEKFIMIHNPPTNWKSNVVHVEIIHSSTEKETDLEKILSTFKFIK